MGVEELRSEFFHCCIFSRNFTRLSTVQSYLCGDRATENSLINVAKPPGYEASQPTDPGRGMSVADNDAGTKDGKAGEADVAHGVFFHAHYTDIAEPATGCASYRGEQAKLGYSGIVAATRKSTNDTELKSFQFFFAPARRPGTDAHATHGTDGALAQNFAGESGSALGKVRGTGIKNDVAHSRSRRDGLSGDHHHFATFRNCQQLRDGRTTNLSGTTKDDYGEILIHQWDLCLRKGCDSPD
jgi:hypothetical protein